MDNIVIVENYEKYCFKTLEEIVKQFLGEDFYDLNNEEKYKRLRLKTVRNAVFNNNAPVIDLRKGEKIENIENKQYIVYDEETFILKKKKNNDNIINLKKSEKKENIENKQYIVYDEETFILKKKKNNDIVMYEYINENIFVKNLDKEGKESLEKLDKDYIIINFCADKLLENKMKNL